MSDIKQLITKDTEKKNIFPKVDLEGIFDRMTAKSLKDILLTHNMYLVPWQGHTENTRLEIPSIIRRKGLFISYFDSQNHFHSEYFIGNELNDNAWKKDENWVDTTNKLSGDITIGANGHWYINNEDSGIDAKGDTGTTPLLRIEGNKLQVSYDEGQNFYNVTDNPVYTQFRWVEGTGNNVGKIEVSTDLGKTWQTFSQEFANNLHIKDYVATQDKLPNNAPEGTIYMVGSQAPYTMYIKLADKWHDNGQFTSFNAGISQDFGDYENMVISQKFITDKLKTAQQLHYEVDDEFLYTIVDNSNHLLFCINKDGETILPKIAKQTYNQILNELKSSIPTMSYFSSDEFLYVILDSEGYILFGIRYDGTLCLSENQNFSNLATKQELEEIKTIIESCVKTSTYREEIEGLEDEITRKNKILETSMGTIESALSNVISVLSKTVKDNKFKGFFLDSSSFPNTGNIGDYLYMSNTKFPGIVYIWKDNGWVNTQLEASVENLDTTLFVKKTEIEDIINNNNFTPKVSATYIKNQEDFDRLDTTLTTLINEASIDSPTVINVFIKGGVYKCKTTITLNSVTETAKNNSNLVVNLASAIGEKVIIISDGDEYTPNDAIGTTAFHYICKRKTKYKLGEGYINQNYKRVNTCDTGSLSENGITFISGFIDIQISNSTTTNWITDNTNLPSSYSTTGVCRLSIPDELGFLRNKASEYFANSIFFGPAWYRVNVCKPQYSDSNYLYFEYTNVSYSDSYKWNVNHDYTFGKLHPSFFLTNILEGITSKDICNVVSGGNEYIYIPKLVSKLYCCNLTEFLNVSKLSLQKFSISGINFCGSKDFEFSDSSVSYKSSLNFTNCKNIEISNNVFESVGQYYAIKLLSRHSNYSIKNPENEINDGINITVDGNIFRNLSGAAVSSTCENSKIINNDIENIGIFNKWCSSIDCSGKNFYIAYNNCKNQSYIGIRVGNDRKATHNISGTLEYNTIYNTPQYQFRYLRETLMDGGGIYIFTHNDNTICNHNIVHDITGKAAYRGIFCDDGAYNMTIKGNLIYNIAHYTIDSRRVKWSSASNTEGQPLNVNNTIGNNILFGTYKFEGCDNVTEAGSVSYVENNCVSLSNFIGRNTSYQCKTIIKKNIVKNADDIYDYSSYIEDGKIYISVDITSLKLSDFIKNRIFHFIKN